MLGNYKTDIFRDVINKQDIYAGTTEMYRLPLCVYGIH